MVSGVPIAAIVVYAILIQPLFYVIWKHGRRGLLGWLVFQMFCGIRIVGSVLQIRNETTGQGLTGSLVVSNFGTSTILLGLLGVLHEARTNRDPGMNTKLEWLKVTLFHGKVILAMVLLIIGIVQEISNHNTNPPVIAKVGVLLLLACQSILTFWTWTSFHKTPRPSLPAWRDATILLDSVAIVLPFSLLRILYSVITVFSTGPGFKNSLAAKVCMNVVPEMLVVLILTVSGIRSRNLVAMRNSIIKERRTSGRR